MTAFLDWQFQFGLILIHRKLRQKFLPSLEYNWIKFELLKFEF